MHKQNTSNRKDTLHQYSFLVSGILAEFAAWFLFNEYGYVWTALVMSSIFGLLVYVTLMRGNFPQPRARVSTKVVYRLVQNLKLACATFFSLRFPGKRVE